jgi:putative colanic acid biosynthesis acetyltransferase WcaF
MNLALVSKSGRDGKPTFPLRVRAFRLLWLIAWWMLISWTPRQMRGWRRTILRAFGARLSGNANVFGSARVWYPPNLEMGPGSCLGPRVKCYNIAPITVGANVIVSQDTHLCTASHEMDSGGFQLVARPIEIRDRVWIAAECFIGPGVVVGEGAVLGARGAAFGDLRPWAIYRGNPAVPIKERKSPQELPPNR